MAISSLVSIPQTHNLSWYPQQVANIFAPFKATTYKSIAIELTARTIMAVVLLVIPAVCLYLFSRSFTAKQASIKPTTVTTTSIASSSSTLTVKPSTSINHRENVIKDYFLSKELDIQNDPLFINFTDSDWKYVNETSNQFQYDYTKPVLIQGFKRYLLLKEIIQAIDLEFWDVLCKEAEAGWLDKRFMPLRPPGQPRWRYNFTKPLFFHAFINARMNELVSGARFLGAGSSGVTASKFTALEWNFDRRESQTEGVYNLLNGKGLQEFKDIVNKAYSNRSKWIDVIN